MFEKVNPSHPDKIADRIAGAMVDLAYQHQENPKVAVEVLIGHGVCNVMVESSYGYKTDEVEAIVNRLAPGCKLNLIAVPQDEHLAKNQEEEIRCGDNGIFKGVPTTVEQDMLVPFVEEMYERFPTDGKFIIDRKKIIVCQSNATRDILGRYVESLGCHDYVLNPLGDWTGGTDVDAGATNRKLGSDMGDSVTGGGLMGKDCSKADVSVNIYAWLKAQKTEQPVKLYCAIGDNMVDGKPYREIVEIAKEYIDGLGGFEKFAEWGLIR